VLHGVGGVAYKGKRWYRALILLLCHCRLRMSARRS
jgi:hypothetical protein